MLGNFLNLIALLIIGETFLHNSILIRHREQTILKSIAISQCLSCTSGNTTRKSGLREPISIFVIAIAHNTINPINRAVVIRVRHLSQTIEIVVNIFFSTYPRFRSHHHASASPCRIERISITQHRRLRTGLLVMDIIQTTIGIVSVDGFRIVRPRHLGEQTGCRVIGIGRHQIGLSRIFLRNAIEISSRRVTILDALATWIDQGC